MTEQARGPGIVVTTLAMLVCLALLIGLGVWQLHRKVWKENLIAAMTERLDAPPQPLPPSDRWATLTQAADEFRPVNVTGTFIPGEQALVYSPGSALRTDVKGPGYFVFAPAKLTGGGTIVVDRGFVPADSKAAAAPAPAGPVTVTGYLRWPESRGMFTPADDVSGRTMFVRDPAAMAATWHWGAVAPFYIDAEAPVPPGGLPSPGRLVVNLPDNHLQYAITWFGLAAGLAGVYGYWLFGRLRRPA